MITADETVKNLVKLIYEIYFDKSNTKLTTNEKKLKKLIDDEKASLKKYIMKMLNLSYYGDNDTYSVISKTIDIIVSRHAITRLIIKLISEKHNSYSLSMFQDSIRFIGKGFGFEIDRLSYTSGLLSYFLENIEHWYKVKGTEDSIESIAKIIFPYANLTTAKFHVFKQKYGISNKYTIIEFKDVSTMTDNDLTKEETNHLMEYSNIIESEDTFVKSSLPIISLVSYVNTTEISIKLRQLVLEILEDPSYETAYVSLTEDYYLSIKEAVIIYMLLLDLFSDNKGGFVQRKWLDYSISNSDKNYIIKQVYNKIFSYLPQQYYFYTSLVRQISEKIVTDFEHISDFDDYAMYSYVVSYISENNLQRPQSFAYDFVTLRDRGVLSNLLTFIKILLNTKNVIDIPRNILIYLMIENLTTNVTNFIYAISLLYNSNVNDYSFITENDLYFLLLEISSKIEIELGIDSVFSSYISVVNVRSIETKDIYDILSSIKPVHLHLSKIGFISDGKINEDLKVQDDYYDNIHDTFTDNMYCVKEVNYCSKVKEYGINGRVDSYNVSNQYVDFNDQVNLPQLVSINNNEIRLDYSRIYADTVFDKFLYVTRENKTKTFLTTHNSFCRDVLTIREEGTNNLEVLSW